MGRERLGAIDILFRSRGLIIGGGYDFRNYNSKNDSDMVLIFIILIITIIRVIIKITHNLTIMKLITS